MLEYNIKKVIKFKNSSIIKSEGVNMKIADILKVTAGKLICGDENIEVENFEKDNRCIKEGDVFVAIKGENFDGNKFYKEAIKSGAKLCILSEMPEEKIGNIVLVEDTIKAISQIAEYKRSLYDIPVVAVTGSVGKTSTKDIIASVMSQKYNVLKTEGNLNNNIGLPFTILRLKNENAIVVEMGMNHFGEISALSKIAKPTLAVITNIGTAHIGNLGTRENILKAKLEILDGLQGNNIVINNDNDLLRNWQNSKYNVITYGIKNKDSMYVAEDINSFETKSIFNLLDNKINAKENDIEVPISGEHFVLNALCAIAVGRYFNISIEDIKKGIKEFKLTKNRMDIFETKSNVLVVNDTYNANYDSMKAAIEYLEKIEKRRKIAVLGDMLELGSYSEELHKKIGECIENIDILITIGENAKIINDCAKVSNKVHFNNNEEAVKEIKSILKSGDAILLKASNSMKFSEIVDKIKD